MIQWKWDLKSLKPFKSEPKTKIGDIISSSNDDEEEGAEYKVKWISNNDWCECSACLLWWLLLAVNSVTQWKHTQKVYAAEKEMIYLNGTSKVSVSR